MKTVVVGISVLATAALTFHTIYFFLLLLCLRLAKAALLRANNKIAITPIVFVSMIKHLLEKILPFYLFAWKYQ